MDIHEFIEKTSNFSLIEGATEDDVTLTDYEIDSALNITSYWRYTDEAIGKFEIDFWDADFSIKHDTREFAEYILKNLN